MVFGKTLALVGIPIHCDELVEEVTGLLTGTDIPVLTLEKDTFEVQLHEAIKNYQINLGFVITFSYKISSSLYNSLPNGFFNVHPGPLPEYRGADPIFQQIKNRERFAGVTIHKLSPKMDAGDIVIKEMINITPADTYGLVNSKLGELAAKLTGTICNMVVLGINIPSKPQDETKARYFKRQTSKDITINWEKMGASTIIALVNACNPWNKGAVTKLNFKIMRIILAENVGDECVGFQITAPGVITKMTDDGIDVSTINNGVIRIGFIFIDEGFIKAGRLREVGFSESNTFQTI
jgi:methionyl-tRNA formyltransferase